MQQFLVLITKFLASNLIRWSIFRPSLNTGAVFGLDRLLFQRADLGGDLLQPVEGFAGEAGLDFRLPVLDRDQTSGDFGRTFARGFEVMFGLDLGLLLLLGPTARSRYLRCFSWVLPRGRAT